MGLPGKEALCVVLLLGVLSSVRCPPPESCSDILVNQRVACGVGFSRDECRRNGCCYSAILAEPACFKKGERSRTAYACEGSTVSINCSSGRIRIERANWGRRSRAICNDGANTEQWSTQCFSTRAKNVVSNMCDNLRSCSVFADNVLFEDPCPTTNKYLEVEYMCRAVDDDKPRTYPPRPSTTPSTTTPTTTTTTPTTTTTTPTTTTPTTTFTTTTPEPTTTTTTPTTTSTTPTTTEPTTTTKLPTLPTPIDVLSPDAKFCAPIRRRDIYWPKTKAGTKQYQPCPQNTGEMASFDCDSNGIWTTNADLRKCVSPRTVALRRKAKVVPLVEVVPEVVIMSQQPVYGGDVVELTSLMTDMVDSVEVEMSHMGVLEQQETTQNLSIGLVKAGSNLLSKEHKDQWDDLPQADQKVAATRLLTAVEKSGFKVANTIKEPLKQSIVNIEINIILEINVISTTGHVADVIFPDKSLTKGHKWDAGSSDCIHLTGNTIKQMSADDGLAKLIFATYSNLQELLAPQREDADRYEEREEETNVVDVIPLHPNEALGEHALKPLKPLPTKPALTTTTMTIPKPTEGEQKQQKVASNIISASINNRSEGIVKLPEPIMYTLEHRTESNIYNPTCSFWEYSEKSMNGKWSTFGCMLIDTNVTHTVCQCQHLTNFAVLMDIVGTELHGDHLKALTVITNVGCILSLICLFVAWLTFQFCKNLQCDRNTIHKNLVFCLFIAELLFITGIAQHEKPLLCSVIAGALHYLFLVSFSWMCLEGVQLYMMLIKVFEAERSYVKYYYVAAYGIPAVIVAISAAVYPGGYGTKNYCWLTTERGFVWAFVGPVMAVISVNIVMLSIAIYVMCRHAAIATSLKMKEKTRLDNIKKEQKAKDPSSTDCPLAEQETAESSSWATHISWVKGAVVLVVLLGLTWTFGLLFLSAETAAFAYIFTILNSLQGLFIFVFHCLMNEKVQKEYKRCARHMTWMPECIRVKYGGAKPYTSTSPHSTSSGSNKLSKPLSMQLSMQYFQRLLSGRRRKRSSTTTLPRSSTTPSTKWNYQNMHAQYSGGPEELAPLPPDQTLSNNSQTEGDDGYLEPINLRIHDSIYAEPDSLCNGDLSMIEGSIVDSAFVSDYCRDGGFATVPTIDVDKYKIKPKCRKPRGLHQLGVDEPHISESEYSDGELFSMTGNGRHRNSENVYEECPLVPPPLPKPNGTIKSGNNLNNKAELERNLINRDQDDDTLKLKKRFSLSSSGSVSSLDSIRKDSPSLNDLNKDGSDCSRNSIYLSTPNIKFKGGAGLGGDKAIYDEHNNVHNSGALQRSMPNLNDSLTVEQAALDKLQAALSSQEDGLITLSHGGCKGRPGDGGDNRLSQDTAEHLASHNYRLTSSDC